LRFSISSYFSIFQFQSVLSRYFAIDLSTKMTAQKGLFNRVPNHSVYAIDEAIQNQLSNQNRTRRCCVSVLIALAGILLLSIIIAVVAFMCWKGVTDHCEECGIESEKSSMVRDNVIPKPEFIDTYWSSEEDTDRVTTTTTTNGATRPKSTIVTTVQPETSAPAPPRPITPTTASTQIDVEDEYRHPWYARLPLIGWMFRSSEVTEARVTKITVSN